MGTGKEEKLGKGREEIGKREGGEGEWGSPTHYVRLKSCTGLMVTVFKNYRRFYLYKFYIINKCLAKRTDMELYYSNNKY